MQRSGNLQLFLLTRLTVKRFFDDAGPQRAAGLAYTTLMAVVPLIGILIGFGGPFMNDSRVQEFLADTMLPAMQAPILEALLDFAENGKRLGFLGLPMFLITAVFLLNTIENAMNRIFRVRSEKNIPRRLIGYMGAVAFAGLFVGSSIALSGDMLKQVLDAMGYRWVYPLFRTRIASILFIFLGQYLLLTLIPGRRVRPASAMTGAAVGAVLWELSKRLFAYWVNRSIRLSVIYGSLFILPLLLIWLMLVWIILLSAAELCYVHQNRIFFRQQCSISEVPGEDLLKALYLYSTILQNHMSAEDPLPVSALAEQTHLTERMTEKLLTPLLEKGFLLRASGTKGKEVFVPGGSPDKLSMDRVLAALTDSSNPEFLYTEDPLIESLLSRTGESLKDLSAAEAVRKKDEP